MILTPVTTRPVQAGDKANRDGVRTTAKDDRYRRGRCLGGFRSDDASGHNGEHLTLHQLTGESRQPVVLAVGPSIFYGDILAFNKTRLA